MLFLKPLAFAASVAALVIPEISEDEENFFRALPIEVDPIALPPDAVSQSIGVPCKQCRDSDTELRLNFDIVNGHRIAVNGFEIYPNADPWQGDLVASAITPNGQEQEQKLGYSLAVVPFVEPDEKRRMIEIDLRIIEVGNQFVEDIPTVKALVLDTESFGVMDFGLVIFDVNLAEDSSSETPCDSMWCLAKGKAGDAWKKIKGGIKGCGGMRGHDHKGEHKGGHKGDHKHPHGRPSSMGHEKVDHKHAGHGKGGHHHHGGAKHHQDGSRHHSWTSAVKSVASYFILPLILGITAGIGVALLAMFVGSLVFRFFNHLCPGRRQAPVSVPPKVAALETVIEEDEKSGLMADQEPPPQYEEENPSN